MEPRGSETDEGELPVALLGFWVTGTSHVLLDNQGGTQTHDSKAKCMSVHSGDCPLLQKSHVNELSLRIKG